MRDNRLDILRLNMLAPAHIEDKLGEFAPAHQPVFAQRAEQQAARLGRRDQSRLAQCPVDQRLKIGFRIGLALDPRALPRALDELAQRRVFFQRAGGEHDGAGGRRRGNQRGDGGDDGFRAGLDQNGATSAEQRRGVGLIEQRERIGGNRVAARTMPASGPKTRNRKIFSGGVATYFSASLLFTAPIASTT